MTTHTYNSISTDGYLTTMPNTRLFSNPRPFFNTVVFSVSFFCALFAARGMLNFLRSDVSVLERGVGYGKINAWRDRNDTAPPPLFERLKCRKVNYLVTATATGVRVQ